MNKMKYTFATLVVGVSLMISLPHATAQSEVANAKRSIATIKKEIRKLKKLRTRAGVRAELAKVTASTRDFRDSDGDSLPDIIENVEGSDSCLDDSDSDGISDGDEVDSGSRPDDSTSTEVEVKSTITAITDSTVTVKGYVFTVTPTSRFKPGTSLSSFKIGDFVEASGRAVSGVLTLKKLAIED